MNQKNLFKHTILAMAVSFISTNASAAGFLVLLKQQVKSNSLFLLTYRLLLITVNNCSVVKCGHS